MIHALALLALALPTAPGADAPAGPTVSPDLGLDTVAAAPAALVSPYGQGDGEEGEEPEYGWEISFQLGAGFTTGSVETQSASAALDAVDTQEKDRKTFRGWWNYQQDENANPKVAQRRIGGSAQYDYFMSEETYVYLTGLIESDLAAGVDLRWTVGPGIGHQFVDKDTYKFSGEAGVSYFVTKLDGAPDQEYWAARLAYRSHWTPNDRYEILHLGEALPAIEGFDADWDCYAKLDTTGKVNLNEQMYAALQWVLDWNSQPAPGFKQANNRVFLTIGWSL